MTRILKNVFRKILFNIYTNIEILELEYPLANNYANVLIIYIKITCAYKIVIWYTYYLDQKLVNILNCGGCHLPHQGKLKNSTERS